MSLLTRRRLTPFARSVLKARAEHLNSLLQHFAKLDINCGQDFQMLLDAALNSGIRQCDIARAIETRRSKLSSWANGISVARAAGERQHIVATIQALLEKKRDQALQLVSKDKPAKLSRKVGRPHPDMIL